MVEKEWIRPRVSHGVDTMYGWRVLHPDNFVLGNKVDIGYGTLIVATHGVHIGDEAQIGGNCCIYSANSEDGTSGKITIGKGARVGAGVIILPDVIIEDGARVGAQSFVMEGTRIKAGETWTGVPATKNENIVAVTGGTGSIGRALVEEMLLDTSIDSIRVISRDEAKHAKMKADIADSRVRYIIADVTSYRHMRRAFENVGTVIHAAAMKRVETSEHNASEVVRVNTYGTENVADACISCGVKKMLLVSTDKAVNPAGVMGESKSLAEAILVDHRRGLGKRTKFYTVRLGNVLGSRGAVIELWDEQRKSGNIMITDHNATRFLLEKREAAQWILSVLKLEPGLHVPVCRAARVGDLATAYCELYGGGMNKMGMREGEKLHEELLTEKEAVERKTPLEEYRSSQAEYLTVAELKLMLEAL